MARNSNRRRPSKPYTLRVSDELQKLSAQIGRSVEEIVAGVSRALIVLPYPYVQDIKNGAAIDKTLREVFEVSEIGRLVNLQIKSRLKLEKFMLEGVDIDFDEGHFFLTYVATTESTANFESLYLTIDKENADLLCLANIPSLKLAGAFKTVVAEFEDELLDRMEGYEIEYEGDQESGLLSISLTPESYDYLPESDEISGTFGRLKKFLAKRSNTQPRRGAKRAS